MKHKKTGITKKYPRIFKIWQGLRQRCNNPNDKDYEKYGGRGITVCKEWDAAFEPFLEWALENGYNEHLSIDRINNNGNYCPDNCRWADETTQKRNRNAFKTNWFGVNGVHYERDRKKYRAVIYIAKKRIDLGRYDTLEEAIAAREKGMALYWGVTA